MDNFVDIKGIESSYVGDPEKGAGKGILGAAMQGTGDAGEGGKAKDYLTPENVGAGLEVIGAIIPGMQKSDQERLIKRACGRRPFIGRAKKERYEQCVSNLITSMTPQQGKDLRTADDQRKSMMIMIVAIILGLILIIILIAFLMRNKTPKQ